MSVRNGSSVLGVLGGMGPLSSAEFMKTIYECSPRAHAREQDAPKVLLYSDPTFPDRTEAFLRGQEDELLRQLETALACLLQMGATKLVLCCMTIHHLLPRLSVTMRAHIISLLDVIYAHLAARSEKHLLICSTGTQKMRLFQRHARWPVAQDRIIFLAADDQQQMHALIYQLKNNRCLPEAAAFLEALLAKYEVEAFIAGCSEVHLLAKHFLTCGPRQSRFRCIDPFALIARDLTEGIL